MRQREEVQEMLLDEATVIPVKFQKQNIVKFQKATEKWVAGIGDEAFKRWARKTGLPCHRHIKNDPGDESDFEMEWLNIDVKTRLGPVIPTPGLDAFVAVKQMKHPLKPTAFVFAWLNEKMKTCYLMGWAFAVEFEAWGDVVKKGAAVAKGDGTNLSLPDDAHRLKYGELRPLSELEKFIRRDRANRGL